MTAPSRFTSKIRKRYWFLKITNLLLLSVPLLVYIGMALSDGGTIVAEKVALVGSVMVALILTVFNIVAQKHLRAPLWIILLGLYVAMSEYLMPLVVILAVTSVLDDLVFTPLIEYYKIKLISSKTMDEREAEEE